MLWLPDLILFIIDGFLFSGRVVRAIFVTRFSGVYLLKKILRKEEFIKFNDN